MRASASALTSQLADPTCDEIWRRRGGGSDVVDGCAAAADAMMMVVAAVGLSDACTLAGRRYKARCEERHLYLTKMHTQTKRKRRCQSRPLYLTQYNTQTKRERRCAAPATPVLHTRAELQLSHGALFHRFFAQRYSPPAGEEAVLFSRPRATHACRFARGSAPRPCCLTHTAWLTLPDPHRLVHAA
eukprot:365204-Chlamydomonas_euryale.AAC.9